MKFRSLPAATAPMPPLFHGRLAIMSLPPPVLAFAARVYGDRTFARWRIRACFQLKSRRSGSRLSIVGELGGTSLVFDGDELRVVPSLIYPPS